VKKIWAIFKKETGSYFNSPVAYVLLAVYAVITGFFFYAMTAEFISYSLRTQSTYVPGIATMNVNEMLIRPLISTYGFICIILLPMLTMRLFAEENSSGTIRLLLSSPISDAQVVIGKYLAALAFFAIMLLTTIIHQAFYFMYSSPELLATLIGYIGLFLMGAAFISIGMFVSAVSRNQIIAVVLTFGILLLFWIITWAGDNASATVKHLLEYIGIYNHHQDMAKGVLDTTDIIYYLSIIIAGILSTRKAIEARRWS